MTFEEACSLTYEMHARVEQIIQRFLQQQFRSVKRGMTNPSTKGKTTMEAKTLMTEADLQTEAFLSAEPAERGTWLTLKVATMRRGTNVIVGAGEWDERKTLLVLGVRRRDLSKPTDLWWWNGNDLHVGSAEHTKSPAPLAIAPAPEPMPAQIVI